MMELGTGSGAGVGAASVSSDRGTTSGSDIACFFDAACVSVPVVSGAPWLEAAQAARHPMMANKRTDDNRSRIVVEGG